MKKQLIKNITQYDDKMLLKFDKATFKALGISLACALPIAVPLWFLINGIVSLVVGISIIAIAFLLLIGKVQGMSLLGYIGRIVSYSFFPSSWRKAYMYEENEYRIRILTEEELKKKGDNTTNENTWFSKFKNKKK